MFRHRSQSIEEQERGRAWREPNSMSLSGSLTAARERRKVFLHQLVPLKTNISITDPIDGLEKDAGDVLDKGLSPQELGFVVTQLSNHLDEQESQKKIAVLNNLGYVYAWLDMYDTAKTVLKEAKQLAEAAKVQDMLEVVQNNLDNIKQLLGE